MVGPITTRTTVRVGIAQYFGGTAYDNNARAYRGAGPLLTAGLSSVRAYTPKRVSDADYTIGQTKGRGMGTYMIVKMPHEAETRRAFAGLTGGERQRKYEVTLACFHLAQQDYSEDAEADVDFMAESIKELIYADRTLGSCCVQAGEGPMGIDIDVDESMRVNERVETYFQVKFEAYTFIIA